MQYFLAKKTVTSLIVFALIGAAIVLALPQLVRAASCQVPATTYGAVSSTIVAPEAATYRVWSRMMASGGNDSYLLIIDDTNCYNVGGGVSANAWAWVNYQDGNTASRIQLALTKGNHTFKMIGTKPDVKLDHLIITSDTGCTPTGTGDNCDVAVDTTPPVVSLLEPQEDATVQGTVTVKASVTDDTSVAKADLYVNGTLIASKTTAPYDFTWDSTASQNGSQVLTVKATDSAGNSSSDSVTVTVQNGDTVAPTQPYELTVIAPAYNKTELAWKASTDNVGVKGYRIIRNQATVATVTGTAYTDTTVTPNVTYTYQIVAYDAAGNTSEPSAAATITTPGAGDTTAPDAPTQLTAQATSATQVNLTWVAATDDIGVVAYDVYRARGSDALAKVATAASTSFGDTGLRANTTYRYAVKAKDAAGNTSPFSTIVTVATPKSRTSGVIKGTIRDQRGKPIPYATVTVSGQGTRVTSRTNTKGNYTIRQLKPGRYSVTYRARTFTPKSVSLKLADATVTTKNITLQKR